MFLDRLPEFIGNHFILVTLFLLVALMLISNEFGNLTRRYKSVAPAELTRLVNRESALLIDVSADAGVGAGHIAGAEHDARRGGELELHRHQPRSSGNTLA